MTNGRGEDAALIARVARADRSALEQLYRRHAVWLTARLQSRCHDSDIVDLAVQDTFISVWTSAAKYRGDGEVGAWIWGIAVRRLADELRRKRPIPVPLEALSATVVSFEDAFIENGLNGALGPAVARLDPDLRAVLVLTAIDGLTTREAAAVLGIPQGTVKTRLQRARSRLLEFLE